MRIIVAVLLLFSSVSYADDTIKIGADFGLSGNVARYGEWGTRGIHLALKEINSNNGINGKKLKVIFEDSEGNPAKAVSAYHKLRNLNKVNFILTYQSSIALAVAPLANRDKIIQMDFSATTPKYSSLNDYTFRTGIVATQLAADAAKILSSKLKVDRLGCLYIENDFGQGMFNVFKKSFPGKIIISESFRSDETDYRPQLLKIKRAKLNHIWLVGHLRESGVILRQAHDLGITAQFYSDVYSVEGPDFVSVAGKAANGVIYVAPRFDPSIKDSVAARFGNRYRNLYGEEATYFAAQAYDAVLALAYALGQCSDSKPSCVKVNLMKINFEGASGRIKFDRNGDVKKQVELKQVVENKFVLYGRSGKEL